MAPSTALTPPACPNANADVESVHNTIETELFDAQVFSSKADFFAKTATYQLWYNAARMNSSRGYKSPADLLAVKAPNLSPKIFCRGASKRRHPGKQKETVCS